MTDIAASPQTDVTPEEQMDPSSSGQDGGAPPPVAPPPQMAAPAGAPPPAASGQPPQAAAPQPGQPPVQVVAAHPRAQLFSSLLGVLGGGNKTQYTVDPQTGTMQSIQVPQSRGQLAKNILAGALTGLMAPEQKPQPGREISQGVMRGAQAQQQKTAQQSQQAQTTATDDYNRQQQVKVRQMQTAEANLRLHAMAQQLGTQDKDVIQKQIDDGDNKTLIAEAQEQGKLSASKLSGKDAMDSQKYPVTDYARVPDDVVQRTDAAGKPVWIHPDGSVGTDNPPGSREAWDATYSVIKNDMSDELRDHTAEKVGANTTVKTPGNLKPWVKDAQFYGIGGPQFANAVNLSGHLPIATGSNLRTQTAGMNFLAAEAENMAKVTGKPLTDAEGNPISGRDYTRQFVKDNPSLLTSVGKWQHAPGVEPDNKYQSLMNSQDPGTQAARSDMAKFFGGEQQFEAYKDAKADARAAGKTTADITARTAAEAKDPKSVQELQNLKDADAHTKIETSNAYLTNAKLKRDAVTDTGVHGPIVNGVDTTYLNSLPIGTQRSLQLVKDGRLPFTAQALRTAVGQNYVQMLASAFPGDDTHPGFDYTKAPVYEKTRQAFTTGKEAKTAGHFSTALQHLSEVQDNIGWTGQLPGVKSLAQFGALGGDAAKKANALNTARDAVGSELAAAYKEGVADQPEVQAWMEKLQTDSPTKLKDNVNEVARLLKGKFDAMQNQWNNGTPFGVVSPLRNLISQPARNAYKRIVGKNIEEPLHSGDEVQTYGNPADRTINTPAPAPPATLLKDGMNTTFKNGQVWTLRNGQPVQVQ